MQVAFFGLTDGAIAVSIASLNYASYLAND